MSKKGLASFWKKYRRTDQGNAYERAKIENDLHAENLNRVHGGNEILG
jgi:hypothetical protein